MSFDENILINMPELVNLAPANYSSEVQEGFVDIEAPLPTEQSISGAIPVSTTTSVSADIWEDAEEVLNESVPVDDGATEEEILAIFEDPAVSEESEDELLPIFDSDPSGRAPVMAEEAEDEREEVQPIQPVPPPDQYARFKGAEWFELVRRQKITIAGLGGIGSWLNLFISRLGVAEIMLYDPDTFESINIAGQFCRVTSIGRPKAEEARNIASLFSNMSSHAVFSSFNRDSHVHKVLLCGFDNMSARKAAFDNWLNRVNLERNNGVNVDDMLFMDGRLTAQMFQIFTIQGRDQWAIDEYRRKWLFDDSQADVEDCTFKQTSHIAGMIGAHMTTLFTNWCSNLDENNFPRRIPFLTEYNSVLNTHHYEY